MTASVELSETAKERQLIVSSIRVDLGVFVLYILEDSLAKWSQTSCDFTEAGECLIILNSDL